MDYVPLARLRPLRELRRRPHGGRRRDARAGRSALRGQLRARPQPGSRQPMRWPTSRPLFSGDVLFQGSVGRVDLPGGDWPTLLSSIQLLIGALPAETTVYPGHMGITTLGQERETNPFLRELAHQQLDRVPAMSVIQAPRGTFDVLPADAARRAVLQGHAERILGAAGYRRIETPTFEATELFSRGVGEATDIVQKEMYSFDDGGGRSHDAASRGNRTGLPGLPRARHAQAAPAGEALVPLELLSGRGAPARSLPPVLAGRGRGDRRGRAGDRRRAHHAAGRAAAGRGRPGTAAAAVQPGHTRRRGPSTARS